MRIPVKIDANMSNTTKKGLFITDDGQNLAFIFILVSSLFLLWGFCNGMIDVMDKHFQEESVSASRSQHGCSSRTMSPSRSAPSRSR